MNNYLKSKVTDSDDPVVEQFWSELLKIYNQLKADQNFNTKYELRREWQAERAMFGE